MARTHRRPRPTQAQTLSPVTTHCPACGHRLWVGYNNYRTVTTLDAVTRLTLRIRHCPHPDCPRYHRPFRPEAEPHFALPQHERLPEETEASGAPASFAVLDFFGVVSSPTAHCLVKARNPPSSWKP